MPTEAQWEYAARGNMGRIYPWGDEFDGTLVNFCDVNCEFSWADSSVDDGYARAALVGTYPQGASWVGALDMAGNVWEWSADWYGLYIVDAQVNPTGPTVGDYRVLRGGGWSFTKANVRSTPRSYSFLPSRGYFNVGFRCVYNLHDQ